MVDDIDNNGVGKSAAWIGDAEIESTRGAEEAATEKDSHASRADGCRHDLGAVAEDNDGVVPKIASEDRDLNRGAASHDHVGCNAHDLRLRTSDKAQVGPAGEHDRDKKHDQ